MANVTIKVDSSEVTKALDELSSKDTRSALQKAVKKAGTFLAAKAKAEAPKKPRKFRGMTKARNARRDKPGSVVSTRHRLSPIFQQGTKDRFTRSGAFRGKIQANPFIARTADRWGDAALDVAERELDHQLDL